jgi:hypothetical protein
MLNRLRSAMPDFFRSTALERLRSEPSDDMR